MDTHGRKHDYLRISLTEKCNMRCVYCMPAEGVPLSPADHILSRSQIKRLAGLFKEVGVKKVRLTGGEPMVRKDIVDIVQDLGQLFDNQVGMTTNGSLLSRRLPKLHQAGLSHLNVSLDSLVPAKNEFMTRRPDTSKVVLKAID